MLDYLGGFLLILTAGFCWIGIGISVSNCSAKGYNYNIVQGLSYMGSVLLCILLLLCRGEWDLSPEKTGYGLLLSFLAGFANFFTYVFTAKAMQKGPNGLVWGMMQGGMIGSFLMGIFFFHEVASFLRLSGLVLILGGILLMGIAKNNVASGSKKDWLLPSLAAFFLVMMTHCCNSLPSYMPQYISSDTMLRTCGIYFGGFTGFLIVTLPGMIREKNYGKKGEWLNAVFLMFLNTSASIFFFYRGLNILAKQGCGGLGYPVAIGVCVLGFSIYSLFILKEKILRWGLLGLFAVTSGIIIIAIR